MSSAKTMMRRKPIAASWEYDINIDFHTVTRSKQIVGNAYELSTHHLRIVWYSNPMRNHYLNLTDRYAEVAATETASGEFVPIGRFRARNK